MYGKTGAVKILALILGLYALASSAPAGEKAPASLHMMYFYNPSCRLCTKTNEVVGTAEEKYRDRMSAQRFNIADPDAGADNVVYMFDLMDEMEVPEEGNVTLAVFLGVLEEEDGEIFFAPRRVLVEGDAIIEKLDAEITDFLANPEKGGTSVSTLPPTTFFRGRGAGLTADA
ncbi:MAG: hypothetical protein LIP77_07580 [Planctomycetes bacterium]|nr:hypothetical protein [Planctomycetota bacterium]